MYGSPGAGLYQLASYDRSVTINSWRSRLQTMMLCGGQGRSATLNALILVAPTPGEPMKVESSPGSNATIVDNIESVEPIGPQASEACSV